MAEMLAMVGFTMTRVVSMSYFSGGAELAAIEAKPVLR